MSSDLKISIITVVYNGEEFLEETILSIINQTYDNIEYIIIDGSSTDGTLDIIKKYEDKIDYWVSEPDEGIYDAMNKGIKLCSGEIIGIVNADDYIYNDTLEKVAQVFEDEMVMYTYGQVDLLDLNNRVAGRATSIGTEHIKYKVFYHMPYLHPTMFIRSKVYDTIGLYDTKYRLSADYDFVLKLVKSRLKGVRLNFSTGVFRLGGQSGGHKSYMENKDLLLKHGVNPLLVYLNTIILFAKMYARKILKIG